MTVAGCTPWVRSACTVMVASRSRRQISGQSRLYSTVATCRSGTALPLGSGISRVFTVDGERRSSAPARAFVSTR